MSNLPKELVKKEVESLTSLITYTDFITAALHTTAANSSRAPYQPARGQLRLSPLVIAVAIIMVIVSVFLLVSRVPPHVSELVAVPGQTNTVPAAAFTADVGKIVYHYLVLTDMNDELRAGTRVRLASTRFDHGKWHYQVVTQDEHGTGEVEEDQLVYSVLTVTPTPDQVPTV